MGEIPLLTLVTKMVGENRQLLEAYREVEAARERALKSGNSAELQRELDKLGAVAQNTAKRFDPLALSAKSAQQQFRDLGVAVKAGVLPVDQAVQRYKSLEAVLKAQLSTLDRSDKGYDAVAKTMRAAAEEARRLETAQRSMVGVYKVDDLKRYETALKDISVAQRAGLATSKDAVTQYRSLQSAVAQQLGSLKEGSREYTAYAKVMGQAGEAARKLEAEQKRLDASFRSDELKRYFAASSSLASPDWTTRAPSLMM